jgi:hypothetical protein
MSINKKIVQMPVLLAIIFGAISLCSLSYIAIQKYNIVRSDNGLSHETQSSDLDKLREEIELLKMSKDNPSLKQKDIQPQSSKIAKTSSGETAGQSNKNNLQVISDTDANKLITNTEFSISRLTQTIFKKLGYYSYGGYEVVMVVSALNEDIYIPKTTTDSTSGITGFVYSIGGDSFRGKQKSQVECSIYESNYCWIKKGKTSEVSVTVWLTLEESGNYSVKFNEMNFRRGANGQIETFSINKETQKIYIN